MILNLTFLLLKVKKKKYFLISDKVGFLVCVEHSCDILYHTDLALENDYRSTKATCTPTSPAYLQTVYIHSYV